ncbi:HEAT repeat domain-containing protein [Planctomycetota bacterium]
MVAMGSDVLMLFVFASTLFLVLAIVGRKTVKRHKIKIVFVGIGMLLLVVAGYVGKIIICDYYTYPTPPEIKIKKFIESQAREFKNTQERIQALYNKNPFIRDAGLKSLAENPDSTAIEPIIRLLKDEQRTKNMHYLGYAVQALVEIKEYSIPFIIDEIKQALDEVPYENSWLTWMWERMLVQITQLPSRYDCVKTVKDKQEALSWWVNWWDQNKNMSQVDWRKQALWINRDKLTSPNYLVRIDVIKELRQLTGLSFSETIINTPPDEYPPIKNRENFTDYPTVEDTAKWEEWFNEFGDIAKWQKWIDENYDYICWSNEKDYFVIDQEAKTAGIPTDEYRKTHPWPKQDKPE